jgi:hypothetical protein
LTLEGLAVGEWRWLKRSEVEKLLALVGLGRDSEELMAGQDGS